MVAGSNVEAPVLIPTYYAGGEFAAILEAIASQETHFGYELVLVDSGATDGTLAVAQRHSLRRLLPGVIKLARNAGGGPRLFAHAVARSLADQYGISLGRLAGADPVRNLLPGVVERCPRRGV